MKKNKFKKIGNKYYYRKQMGVDYNIIIAKGLVLYDPDSYIGYTNYDDIDGVTDISVQKLYNEYKGLDYKIVSDRYSNNSPIFIYDKNSVKSRDVIYRAHDTCSFDEIAKPRGLGHLANNNFDFENNRPYIVGKDPAVYPLNFYDYDEVECQVENIDRILKLFPCNDGDGVYHLKNKKINKNKMRFGEFVFIYYT